MSSASDATPRGVLPASPTRSKSGDGDWAGRPAVGVHQTRSWPPSHVFINRLTGEESQPGNMDLSNDAAPGNPRRRPRLPSRYPQAVPPGSPYDGTNRAKRRHQAEFGCYRLLSFGFIPGTRSRLPTRTAPRRATENGCTYVGDPVHRKGLALPSSPY